MKNCEFMFNGRLFTSIMMRGNEHPTSKTVLNDLQYQSLYNFIKINIVNGMIVPDGYLFLNFEVNTIVNLKDCRVYSTINYIDTEYMLKSGEYDNYLGITNLLEAIQNDLDIPDSDNVYWYEQVYDTIAVNVLFSFGKKDENGEWSNKINYEVKEVNERFLFTLGKFVEAQWGGVFYEESKTYCTSFYRKDRLEDNDIKRKIIQNDERLSSLSTKEWNKLHQDVLNAEIIR